MIFSSLAGIAGCTISQTNTLIPEKWQRVDKHDGYVVGNGKMYLVAALGKELRRTGKTHLSDKKTDLTRIDWIIGPTYTIGNLGYGWDIIPIIDHDTIKWEKQQIINPGWMRPGATGITVEALSRLSSPTAASVCFWVLQARYRKQVLNARHGAGVVAYDHICT